MTAVDIDLPSLELARAQDCEGITYLEADFMTADLPETYDVVVALAVMHHVPLEAGLERLKSLLNPGGMLLVVGLAASDLPRDAGWDAAARARASVWPHDASRSGNNRAQPCGPRRPPTPRFARRRAVFCLAVSSAGK